MKKQINKIKCMTCNTELESKFRHDFQSCKCGNSVDGGLDYRRVGGNLDDIEIWDWKNNKWEKLKDYICL